MADVESLDGSETLRALYGLDAPLAVQELPRSLSPRVYHRLQLGAAPGRPRSVIRMQLPEPFGPGSSARAQAEDFVDVQKFLAGRGIPVPALYGVELARGRLLLEDLGDLTFETRLRRDGQPGFIAHYQRAIELLAELHAVGAPPQPEAACVAFRRRYQPALLRSELDHFREWGIEALHGPLPSAARAELDTHFDALTAAIVGLPDGFVHRDYQSRNLLWPSPERLVVIDFQDAMIGPAPYDLVALLCDSYVEIEPALQAQLRDRYAAQRGYDARARAELQRGFDLITIQRKLKDAGRFVFIDRMRGMSEYLRFYAPSLRHVARALGQRLEFQALGALLEARLPGFPDCPTPPSVR